MPEEEEIAWKWKEPNFVEKTLTAYQTGGISMGKDGIREEDVLDARRPWRSSEGDGKTRESSPWTELGADTAAGSSHLRTF